MAVDVAVPINWTRDIHVDLSNARADDVQPNLFTALVPTFFRNVGECVPSTWQA